MLVVGEELMGSKPTSAQGQPQFHPRKRYSAPESHSEIIDTLNETLLSALLSQQKLIWYRHCGILVDLIFLAELDLLSVPQLE